MKIKDENDVASTGPPEVLATVRRALIGIEVNRSHDVAYVTSCVRASIPDVTEDDVLEAFKVIYADEIKDHHHGLETIEADRLDDVWQQDEEDTRNARRTEFIDGALTAAQDDLLEATYDDLFGPTA